MFSVIFLSSSMLGMVLGGKKCPVNILDTNDYLGCFVDTRDRLLPNFANLGYAADNNRCMLRCRDFGFKFAGTQNSQECYCGNDPWRYTAADVDPSYVQDYDCDHPCLADSSQICGGAWRLSVYSTGFKSSKTFQSGYVMRRYITMGKNMTIADSKTPISSLDAKSKNLCAAVCSENDVCTGFVYSKTTGLCQLYGLNYRDLCNYTLNDEGNSVTIVE